MVPQAVTDKAAALDALYERIKSVAKGMGGDASVHPVARNVPSIMVAEPRSEAVPALLAQMPDDFAVEFSPTIPLSIPGVLNVQVRRMHKGLRKNDGVGFNLGTDGWRKGTAPLADADISECLTLTGPPPAF